MGESIRILVINNRYSAPSGYRFFNAKALRAL